MEINYAQLSDAIDPQYRINAGKLADIMARLTHGQHIQNSWAKPDVRDNHPCGTPHCALGWGLHEGLAPGIVLAVGCYVYGDGEDEDDVVANLLREYPSAKQIMEDGTLILRIDTMTREDYTRFVLDDRITNSNRYVFPLREATGDVLDWGVAGSEFFGAAVMAAVFAEGELTTAGVVERLRQYANCGFIDNEFEKRHFIAARDEASRLATTLDGWIERSANNAPTPHDCVAYYPE